MGEPLDHVRVTDIVQGLGLTIGAVYHYWENQDDYRDDLLDLLLSPEEYPSVRQAGEAVAEAVAQDPPFEELVRVAATISFANLVDDPTERLTLALLGHDDAEILDRLGAQSAEVGSRWAELFGVHFPTYGLEPRPPFTYDSIAAVLMGMVQGLNIRRLVDAPAVGGELAPDWNLFASSALAFLLGATRPVSGDDDPAGGERDLWALAERLVPRRRPGPPEAG